MKTPYLVKYAAVAEVAQVARRQKAIAGMLPELMPGITAGLGAGLAAYYNRSPSAGAALGGSIGAIPFLLKGAAAAGRVGRLLGPASGLGRFLENNEHAIDVAGLGVLAAPSAAGLARAKKDPEARKDVAHNAAELGGLGILAAPGIAHLLSKH